MQGVNSNRKPNGITHNLNPRGNFQETDRIGFKVVLELTKQMWMDGA